MEERRWCPAGEEGPLMLLAQPQQAEKNPGIVMKNNPQNNTPPPTSSCSANPFLTIQHINGKK